jgi:hypothetical protein
MFDVWRLIYHVYQHHNAIIDKYVPSEREFPMVRDMTYTAAQKERELELVDTVLVVCWYTGTAAFSFNHVCGCRPVVRSCVVPHQSVPYDPLLEYLGDVSKRRKNYKRVIILRWTRLARLHYLVQISRVEDMPREIESKVSRSHWETIIKGAIAKNQKQVILDGSETDDEVTKRKGVLHGNHQT